MPFDFPASPTEGQQIAGPNGATYTYQSGRWVAGTEVLTEDLYVNTTGDTMTGALDIIGAPDVGVNPAQSLRLHSNDDSASVFVRTYNGAGPAFAQADFGIITADLGTSVVMSMVHNATVGDAIARFVYLPVSFDVTADAVTEPGHLTNKAYVDSLVGGAYTEAEADARFVNVSGDTMTGALALPAGSLAAPALTMGDTNSGLYGGADVLNFATAGVNRVAITTTYLSCAVGISAKAGTITSPGIVFGDADTGIWAPAADQLGFAAAGANRLTITSTAITSTLPVTLPADPTLALQAATKQYVDSVVGGAYTEAEADARFVNVAGDSMTGALLLPAGTFSAPALAFAAEPTTGIYNNAAGSIGFAIANSPRANITTTAFFSSVPFRGPNGDATAPGLSFTNDADTGWFSAGADTIGMSVGGTERLRATTTAIIAAVVVRGPDGTAAAPSFSFANSTNSGMFRAGAGVLGFSTGGVERLRIDNAVSVNSTLPIVLPGAPTADLHAATKLYVDARQLISEKGQANGYAPLDGTAKIASAYLPAYVDDVLEFANLAAFPALGTAGVIYVALDTNKVYRWGGSSYTEISPSPGSTDAVPEGATNLYFTTGRASAAAPVQTVAGRTGAVVLTKADVGLSNVDNTSDVDKPVSTAQAAADALRVLKSGDTMSGALLIAAGTAALPSLAISGDPDTGMYAYGGNQIGFATGGVNRLVIGISTITATNPFAAPAGTAAAPGFSFTGEPDCGLWVAGANQMGIATGGVNRLTVATASITSTLPIVLPGDPTGVLEAAPKQYVDTQIATRLTPAAADAAYVNLAGDTMTGALTIEMYGGDRNFRLNTSGASTGGNKAIVGSDEYLDRWALYLGAGIPEDFLLQKYDDTGLVSSNVLSISRSAAEASLHGNRMAGVALIVRTAGLAAAENALVLQNQFLADDSSVELRFQRTNGIHVGAIRAKREGAANNGSLIFSTAAAGVLGEALTIGSNNSAYFVGNVGIGVPAPTQKVEVDGNIKLIGTATGRSIQLDTSDARIRSIFSYTAGVSRWAVNIGDNAAESGANAGSNFGIASYDDAGAAIGTAFAINRASRNISMGIGTPDSVYRLHVRTDGAAAAEKGIVLLNANTGNDSEIDILFRTSSGAPRARIRGQREGANNNGKFVVSTFVAAAETDALTIGSDRVPIFNSDRLRLATAKTPASATATGVQGDISWDANYIYVCVAANTWRRVAHATW